MFYWTDTLSNHHDCLLVKFLNLVKSAALKLSSRHFLFPCCWIILISRHLVPFFLTMDSSQSLLLGALVFVLCMQDLWRDSFEGSQPSSELLTPTLRSIHNLTLGFWFYEITPLGCPATHGHIVSSSLCLKSNSFPNCLFKLPNFWLMSPIFSKLKTSTHPQSGKAVLPTGPTTLLPTAIPLLMLYLVSW